VEQVTSAIEFLLDIRGIQREVLEFVLDGIFHFSSALRRLAFGAFHVALVSTVAQIPVPADGHSRHHN
jgi:hypothetical protein